jgi:hypothetical protein
MATVGAVSVLRGFVPVDDVERLRRSRSEHGWGLWIADVRDPTRRPR